MSGIAEKLKSLRRSAIAKKVRLGAFTQVLTIDDTVAQLLQVKAAEIKHNDFSVEEFNSNHFQTENKWTYSQTAVGEMQVKMWRAEEDRVKQNNNSNRLLQRSVLLSSVWVLLVNPEGLLRVNGQPVLFLLVSRSTRRTRQQVVSWV